MRQLGCRPPTTHTLARLTPQPLSRADILEDLQTSYSWMDPAWHDKPGDIGMVDYLSKLLSGMHWPEYAEKLDRAVYPGLLELLPLVKSVDCFAELCVLTRWPEGEPALNVIPDAASLEFAQVGGG